MSDKEKELWGNIMKHCFNRFYFYLIKEACIPRKDEELFYSILSYSILSYPILSYPILSYPILSYPILSYPILFYSVLFHFIPFPSILLLTSS